MSNDTKKRNIGIASHIGFDFSVASKLPTKLIDANAKMHEAVAIQDKEKFVVNQIKACYLTGDEISISVIQRKFGLGYNAAWRIVDVLVDDKFLNSVSNSFGQYTVA